MFRIRRALPIPYGEPYIQAIVSHAGNGGLGISGGRDDGAFDAWLPRGGARGGRDMGYVTRGWDRGSTRRKDFGGSWRTKDGPGQRPIGKDAISPRFRNGRAIT